MANINDKLKSCIVPKHIAFIMDGNGRWAEERGKKRTYGHKEGGNTLKEICKESYKIGVEYVTVYAFSTENWKRSKEEVDFLMDLLRNYLKESIKTSKKDNMKVTVIGNRAGLPDDINRSIDKLHEESQANTGLNLQIALNYGGRDEIIRGIKKVISAVEKNDINCDDINEDLFSAYLDTKDIPDPDLLIRTSGEIRLSNFLLWQIAYSEFCFIDKYWPDLNIDDVINAIIIFNKKERRYGGV